MTQVLATGLAMGCIYALVGLSFILMYNATHGLNFAHGELVMLSAFVFYSSIATGAPYWSAILMTLGAMAAFGAIYQRLLFHPLRDRPMLAFVIATIGFSIFARNLALLVWGPNPLRVPSAFTSRSIDVFGIVLPPEQLFVVVVTAVVLLVQYYVFFHTDLGRRLRATAQNIEMAQLLGIRPNRMIAITFVVASALCGIAGVLVAPIFLVDVDLGISLILKVFIAVIIGGFGSIQGAVVGGILVGLLEILVAVFISSVYKDAICFLLLIIFLIAFPRGLFGEPVAEKA